VFVLDYSGSVSKAEWKQAADFTIEVMKSFNFGENAAAAACIQFNAPSCGSFPANYMGTVKCNYKKNTTTSRYVKDKDYSKCTSAKNASAASVLAGADSPNGKTVSILKDDLISVMSMERQPSGQTCQACGLELAMKVFDRSPRNSYRHKPHRIVIAVTDGVDFVPHWTQDAADRLRNEYGALFIGIGVGLSCDYDIEFISNLSSSVISGDTKAYFHVTNYGAIRALADQMFTPICDEFQSECGDDCQGFCGCGQCFCPSCNKTGDVCQDYNCTARDGTSHGCEMTDMVKCAKDTKCIQYSCNALDGTCNEIRTCGEMEAKNPGKCRSVRCEDGKCIFTKNDDYCYYRHKKDCEKWRCGNENETADSDGCVKVGDESCETPAEKCVAGESCDLQSDECFERWCDPTDGCMERDICSNRTNECYSYACVMEGGKPVCKATSLLRNHTCMHERCDDSKGLKIEDWLPQDKLEVACSYINKCQNVSCDREQTAHHGECVFIDRQPPGDDPCVIYTCTSETGDWTETPKCDDGLECTIDKCSVDGVCKHIDVNCYDEINMTEYPCFRAVCKEDVGGHRCVRKLKPGVFIDICGNCIRNGETDESSDNSEETISCTVAPDEPILVDVLLLPQ